ncbi:hypothetical protein K438DRAFT_1966936 [Mycena galopus ATCC 62051]|nr:hypothetical protein K438DRAFT_1966936 [Mycena galopus ATCC 62051]
MPDKELQVQPRVDRMVTRLKQREQSKSAARRELNAIHDPVGRLPLELSSAIFIQCLPRSAFLKPKPRTAPMLFLSVCSAWSEIALSIPALWTSIHLDVPRVDVLLTWIQRSRNHPLSISLRNSLDSGVSAILRQYANQLKHLKIFDEELDDLASSTGLQSLPRLETLTIGQIYPHKTESNYFSFDHIGGLLRLAPNLVECSFHDIRFKFSEDVDKNEPILLPHLLCLKFGTDIHSLSSGDSIIRHLSLPALKTLALPLTNISGRDLSLFLERSSPRLQTLLLGSGCGKLRSSELVECLRAVPSLLHLELNPGQNTTLTVGLFSALTEPHLLPQLGTVKVVHLNFDLGTLCPQVIRALSVRRTQLVHVDIRILSAFQHRLDADMQDKLQTFVIEGSKIWIGNSGLNYIWL